MFNFNINKIVKDLFGSPQNKKPDPDYYPKNIPPSAPTTRPDPPKSKDFDFFSILSSIFLCLGDRKEEKKIINPV
ncbi:MAG: hypothetical protein ACO26G_02090 [Rickettsiales bacterium]